MRRAFSLLEVMIAVSVSAVIGGVTLWLLARTNDHVSEGLSRADAARRVSAAARVIERELVDVSAASITLSTPAPFTGAFTAIRFRRVTGYDADASQVQLGPWQELRFELESGERWAATAADDDRDGLVDEGRWALFQDANGDGALTDDERVANLAQGVNGSTLGLALPSGSTTPVAGDAQLQVTFSVQTRTRRGDVETRARDLRIALRNQ